MKALALSTVILHDSAGAPNDLAGIPLLVDLAETDHDSESLGILDLDEVDLVLSTQRLDEFDVFGLCASLHEDAKVGLPLVQRLGAFTESTRKTIVDEGILQDLL